MFLVIVIIVVIIVIIAKGNGYWAADKRNKINSYFGGQEGYCCECKHCRERNGGMICALSRTDDITQETRMPCFEKPIMTEEDLKELFKLDLWTDAGKVYISQNLCGRRMTFSELDAFLKRIPIERPHYMKGNETSKRREMSNTTRPVSSTNTQTKEVFRFDSSRGLEQQLINFAEQYKQPKYKIDMLRESFRRKHEMECNGYHVIESIKKGLPYFLETEWEEHEILDVLTRKTDERPIREMMDAAFFYNDQQVKQAHDLKRRFWQDKIIDAAKYGNREAQAALCSHFATIVFGDRSEELARLKEQFEERLWNDAKANDKHALLGVGAWLCGMEYEKAIEHLQKAASQHMTDAYYWMAYMMNNQWYEETKSMDDGGEKEKSRREMRLKVLECYRKGAECANGTWTRECQSRIAAAYEDGDEIPQNLDLAKHWFTKAAESGDEYSKRHLENMNRNYN